MAPFVRETSAPPTGAAGVGTPIWPLTSVRSGEGAPGGEAHATAASASTMPPSARRAAMSALVPAQLRLRLRSQRERHRAVADDDAVDAGRAGEYAHAAAEAFDDRLNLDDVA